MRSRLVALSIAVLLGFTVPSCSRSKKGGGGGASSPGQTGAVSAPTNLTATAVSSSAVQLTWTDTSTNESGFKIEMMNGINPFAEVAIAGPDTQSFTITGLAAITTYTFRIRGTNNDGDSDYSNEASATTLSSTTDWTQTTSGNSNGADSLSTIVTDATGIYVGGIINTTSGQNDIYVSKRSLSDGSTLWEKIVNGAASGPDRATALVVQGSNIYATGAITNVSGATDLWVAQFDTNSGTQNWQHTIPGTGGDAVGLAIVADGSGAYVAGVITNTASLQDAIAAKFSASNGALTWKNEVNGTLNENDTAGSIALDGTGVYVGGSVAQTGAAHEAWVAKYNLGDGSLAWESMIGSTGTDDYLQSIALGPNAIYVAGAPFGGNTKWIQRLNSSNGSAGWNTSIPGTSADGLDVFFLGRKYLEWSNNVLYYASSDSIFGTGMTFAALNDATGSVNWTTKIQGANAGQERVLGLMVDSSTSSIFGVGIISEDPLAKADAWVGKLTTSGIVVWEKHYNGAGNENDRASAVAMDSANVFAVGYLKNTISGQDGWLKQLDK